MSTLQNVLNQLGGAFTGSSVAPIDGNTLSQPSTLSFIGDTGRRDDSRTGRAVQRDVRVR